MKRILHKKVETSKKILYITDLLVVVITISTIVLSFITRDTSVLESLITGIFGLAGVSHGFYFWKAKAENLHKFGRDEEIRNGDNFLP